MQLFLIKPDYGTDATAVLTDAGLCHQISRVLRMHPGDTCFVQYEQGGTVCRDQVVISEITKKTITIQKQDCQKHVNNMSKTTCIISYPNSPAKAELIVQKLTEIGVGSIIFRRSARSQAKFDLAKKRARLETIIKEAVEQSRGRGVPSLEFCSSSEDLPVAEQIIIADTPTNRPEHFPYHDLGEYTAERYMCYIGPEGGRGDKDYAYFANHTCYLLELGTTVLRMETAAIIAAWECHHFAQQAKQ